MVGRTNRVLAVLAGLIGLALGVVLGVIGSFLVPFRIGGTAAPVSVAVAVAGNLIAGFLAGAAGRNRFVAALPGLGWIAVVLELSMQRTEGDLVVVGSTVGEVFVLTGAVAAAVPVLLFRSPRRTSPAGAPRR